MQGSSDGSLWDATSTFKVLFWKMGPGRTETFEQPIISGIETFFFSPNKNSISGTSRSEKSDQNTTEKSSFHRLWLRLMAHVPHLTAATAFHNKRLNRSLRDTAQSIYLLLCKRMTGPYGKEFIKSFHALNKNPLSTHSASV